MSKSPKETKKALNFSAIVPARAVDEIESQIRSMIANGNLRPGDKLPSERDLAVQLNVSRNTLRESLRSLEYAGVIEMKKGGTGGAYILPGSSSAIIRGVSDLYHLGAITPEQLTEARIWLSEIIVRVVCERATEEDLVNLEENIEGTKQAQEAGLFEERQRLNREFHLILAKITRNPVMISMMEAIMEVTGYFIKEIGPRDNPYTLPSRNRLLAYLRKRDVEYSVKEISTYLGKLQSTYLEHWAKTR